MCVCGGALAWAFSGPPGPKVAPPARGQTHFLFLCEEKERGKFRVGGQTLFVGPDWGTLRQGCRHWAAERRTWRDSGCVSSLAAADSGCHCSYRGRDLAGLRVRPPVCTPWASRKAPCQNLNMEQAPFCPPLGVVRQFPRVARGVGVSDQIVAVIEGISVRPDNGKL